MRRRPLSRAAACVAGLVVLGACAAPGYNPTRVESELVKAGTTPEQARCVSGRLSSTFDLNQLGSHSEPTGKELAKTRAILTQCGVNLPLKPS